MRHDRVFPGEMERMISWVVLSVPAKAVAYLRSIEARVNSPDAEYKNCTVQRQLSVEPEGRMYVALRTFQGATSTVSMSTDKSRIY
jgi:hypothetical protein